MKKNLKGLLVTAVALMPIMSVNAATYSYTDTNANGTIDTGDVVCVDKECFNVLNSDSSYTTMITKSFLNHSGSKQTEDKWINLQYVGPLSGGSIASVNSAYNTTLTNLGFDAVVETLDFQSYSELRWNWLKSGIYSKSQFENVLDSDYSYYVLYGKTLEKLTDGEVKNNKYDITEGMYTYARPSVKASTSLINKIKNGVSLTVKYVDEDGNELKASTTTNKAYNSSYTTSAEEITGYDLVETPANAAGTMTDNTTVTYVYAKKSYTLTINYVDNNGKTLKASTSETVKYNDEYETSAEEITGYKVIKTTGTTKGNISDNTEVTYTYAPVANLFIRLDASIQYENGKTSYSDKDYVYVGTTTVNGKIVYDSTVNADSTLEVLSKLDAEVDSNTIESKIDDEEVIKFLNDTYGIKVGENQVIVWYVIKSTTDTAKTRSYKTVDGKTVQVTTEACKFHIDGVIKNVEETPAEDDETPTEEETTPTEEETTPTEEETTPTEEETTTPTEEENIYGEGGEDFVDEEETKEVVESRPIVQTGSEVDYSIMSSTLITLSLVGFSLYASKKKNNK